MADFLVRRQRRAAIRNLAKQEAERELSKRIADKFQGVPASSKPNTVLFEELAQDVITDYGFNDYKSTSDQEARFRLHLLPFFGRRKAQTITTADVKAYHEWRKKQGAVLGTIARELQLFKHTLTLAKNSSPPKILMVPYIRFRKRKTSDRGFSNAISSRPSWVAWWAICAQLRRSATSPVGA
jgi:hypothetical protein